MNAPEKKTEESVLKKLINASEEIIHFPGDTPDYNEVLQIVLDLSGARYATLNYYDDNGLDCTTISMAGISENIKKAVSFLGFDIVNRHWKYDPSRSEKTKHQPITRFENLYDLVGNVISKNTLSLIEKAFSIGEVFVVNMIKENKIIGDFTLIFNKGETLENSSLIELFSHQAGLFIDREKILKLLRESEKRQRSIIQTAMDGFWITDPQGNLLEVNEKYCTMSGYTQEELLTMNVRDVEVGENADSENADFIASHTQKIMENGEDRFESKHRRKDGSLFDVEINVQHKRFEGERLVGFLRDITQQKLIETDKSKQREILQRVFDNIPVMITYFNETGKVEMVNHEIIEKLGWTFEDWKIQNILANCYPDPETFKEVLDFMVNRPMGWKDFKTTTKYGTVLDTSWTNIVLPNGASIGIGQDITERKQTIMSLIEKNNKIEAQNIELQQTERLKSAILANISHEIRTPLNSILGFANLLNEPNLTGERQQEYIRIIEKSSKRLLSTIKDIVDMSKIETGMMKKDIKELNINKQIEQIFSLFEHDAKDKNLSLSFKTILSSNEILVNTDEEKIYSILCNLVNNAIKYTNEGSIEFGYVLKPVSDPVELEFFVKDTGIGISEENHTAIFDRFYQIDTVNKEARQGAGLGLPIAKAYVEMLGGKIWVESEEGKGSIFYFTLPYSNNNNKQPLKHIVQNTAPAEGEINKMKKLKILIAEDDEASQMLISIIVKKFSKQIFKASTGIEAVEICRNNPDIDLIFMDIQMPDLNGYEAARQIRQLNKDIVIIAQTAYGLSGDREKAIQAGCDDYISKPINSHALISLIKKYFNL